MANRALSEPIVLLLLLVAIAFCYLNVLFRCNSEFGTSGIGDEYCAGFVSDSGWPFVSHQFVICGYPSSTSQKPNELELIHVNPIAILGNLFAGIVLIAATMTSFRNGRWFKFTIKTMVAIIISVAISIQLCNYVFEGYGWSNLIKVFPITFGRTFEFNDNWLNLLAVFLLSIGITSCMFHVVTVLHSVVSFFGREKTG